MNNSIGSSAIILEVLSKYLKRFNILPFLGKILEYDADIWVVSIDVSSLMGHCSVELLLDYI